MGTRRRILLAVALVVVLGGAARLVLRSPAEPSYQGKNLSEWLAGLQRIYAANSAAMVMSNKMVYHPNEQRNEYQEAIRQIGPDAMPTLLSMLQAQDPGIKSKLAGIANKLPIVNVHIATAKERQRMAALGFEALGLDAQPYALPQLAKLFANSDPTNRFNIAKSISNVLPARSSLTYWYSGNGYHRSPMSSNSIHEFSREELLKALGRPAFLGNDWAAYQIDNFDPVPPGIVFLYVEFSDGRVIDSFIGPSTSKSWTNSPPEMK